MKDDTIKILIVDDDEVNINLIVHILSPYNFEIFQAINGTDCLEIVEKQKPDLILMDVILPDANGFALCQRIKSNPDFEGIFIIIISGSRITAQDKIHGIDPYADGYITRPFNKQDFLNHIKSMIRIISVEKKLRLNEREIRAIMESTPVGICITNSKGIFEEVNPAYCAIYKYEETELIGNHFSMVVPDEAKEILSDLHDKFIETGQEIRGEWEVVDRLNNRLTILADAARIIGLDGTPKKVTFVNDITERKKLEKIQQDTERLIRHDLKNPISGIMGFAELMLSNPNLNENERQEYLNYILKSSENMIYLIDSSSDFIKMEEGNYELKSSSINLIKVLNEIKTDLIRLHTIKKLEIVYSINKKRGEWDEFYLINGEEIYRKQMFSNLIKNAIEAAPEKSLITISVSENSVNHIISIHNWGIIPDPIRDNFFDRYATSGKSDGTGLGTYSAKLIAIAHGGDINFESCEEKGTFINIQLPK